MTELRLQKLPDRTPIKVTIALMPELHAALCDYAEVYRDTYGEAEPVSELIPQMLAAFVASDRGFAKARKNLPGSVQRHV
ncbi:DUF2274 domain-containing protein [Altererythrobacter sp. Root672]|uniref:DUF2274 domain-containing protein n=1 Tax=Altererythrobacter sp. Root672 TaxID=1736584 RepID=UPI0006F8754F|nr:DUF2274 domain-containing protein [Altererythrobacter sp. Root672]KRA84035.1 transposase [Altererythrobacter sp. Root672]